MNLTIALGADHAAYSLKSAIKDWLISQEYEILDFGTHSDESVDYTDFIYPAVKSISNKKADYAIVMCGTGLGASYVANKVHGIRASLCQEEFSACLSRQHNDANVLVLGSWILPPKRAIQIIEIWLNTPFEEKQHAVRIQKIHDIEKKECIDHKNP